ncbi:MAG: restriction endonuclease [Selenomonadaceae bacterium]|nr:restriction endonuclease [Selenomonadaceae bacterium]
MAIYAYGAPHDEGKKYVYESLVNEKISRYLWSWFDNCDLNRLKNIPLDKMTSDEQTAWKKGRRLLDFHVGDWVLHKNVPRWGQVTAARLSGEYFYRVPQNEDDGRQCFKVDKVFTFDRTDEHVHPDLYRKINVRGHLYRIYSEKEFYKSLAELGYKFDEADYKAAEQVGFIFNDENPVDLAESAEIKPPVMVAPIVVETPSFSKDTYLNREANEILGDFTKSIYRNKPGKRLENFLAEVFRRIPGVTDVKENGSGWGTDYGADLIVKYNLERIKGVELEEQTWVVQVKSYEGEHRNTNGVDQLRTAIETFDADVGILITTAERTQILETACDKLSDEMSKKNVSVYLIAGVEVAQFVLRYGLDLLI